MSVNIRFLGILAEIIGEKEKEIEMSKDDNNTLKAVFRRVMDLIGSRNTEFFTEDDCPKRVLVVIVDGVDYRIFLKENRSLKAGSKIQFIPIVHGGRV